MGNFPIRVGKFVRSRGYGDSGEAAFISNHKIVRGFFLLKTCETGGGEGGGGLIEGGII